MSWNASSFKDKKDGIKKNLNDTEANTMLIQKTKLKPHVKFNIPNYKKHGTDRLNGLRGDIMILIKKGIEHKHYRNYTITNIGNTTITVTLENYGITTIVSAYEPLENDLLIAGIEVIPQQKNKVIIEWRI